MKYLYERTLNNKHRNITFYIREVPPVKNYPSHIKKYDKLLLIGLRDNNDGKTIEWPYSFKDQEAMWIEVIKTFVLDTKRKTVMKRWKEFIQEAMSIGIVDKFEVEENEEVEVI